MFTARGYCWLLGALLIPACSGVSRSGPVAKVHSSSTTASPVLAAVPSVAGVASASSTDGLGVQLPAAAKMVIDASSRTRPPFAAVPWDHRSDPHGLDLVRERFGLTAAERQVLFTHGFVVLAERQAMNWADALHDVHQLELPLYVSADALTFAVMRMQESLLSSLEDRIDEKLDHILPAMQQALKSNAVAYDPAVARDLAVYLEVATKLGTPSESWHPDGVAMSPADPIAFESKLAAHIHREAWTYQRRESLTLFGRFREIDWARFTPSGRYRTYLAPYFVRMTWLLQFEFNMVSRGGRSSSRAVDRAETPLEAVAALALADIARRAGVLGEVAELAGWLRMIAGTSEEMSILDVAALLDRVPDLRQVGPAFATLKEAIGGQFRPSVPLHLQPAGKREWPTVATFFARGLGPEARALDALRHHRGGSKRLPRPLDLAVVLGHERAGTHLERSKEHRADLLAEARAVPPVTDASIYKGIFDGIASLGDAPPAIAPSFMRSEAFADLRINSTVHAYARLRHAFGLYAATGYVVGGCRIPDAFIEPALPLYDELIRSLRTMRTLMEPTATEVGRIDEALLILQALRAIVVDELAGRSLSPEQLDFLAMVAETPRTWYRPNDVARHDGWYPRLFLEREDAFDRPDFETAFSYSDVTRRRSVVGGAFPTTGIFVVDVGGRPRVMVGPVARAYERVEVDQRSKPADDSSVERIDEKPKPSPPWEQSYLVHRQAPRLNAYLEDAPGTTAKPRYVYEFTYEKFARADVVVRVESVGSEERDIFRGPLTVEVVGEHGETLARHQMQLDLEHRECSVTVPRSDRIFGCRLRLPSGETWSVPHRSPEP